MLLTRQVLNQFAEEGNKLNEKYLQEKRKNETLGQRWTKEEKMRRCQTYYSDYRNVDQKKKPVMYECKQPECPHCRKKKATIDESKITKQLDLARDENPKLKVRQLDGVLPEQEDALQKRIRRNGGDYTRKVCEDGTRLYIIQIEDVYDSQKMRQVFGREIRPRTVVNKETDDSYETYWKALEDAVQFEDTVSEHNENGHHWSGSLHKELTQDETEKYRMRFTLIIPKTQADKDIISKAETIYSTEIVNSMDELQAAKDRLDTRDIEMYAQLGAKFEVQNFYRYVKADSYELWNEMAKTVSDNENVRVSVTALKGVTETRTFQEMDTYDDEFEQLAMAGAE